MSVCLAIAETNFGELKGFETLTPEQQYQIGIIRADVQNELGDMGDLLKRNKLKYQA